MPETNAKALTRLTEAMSDLDRRAREALTPAPDRHPWLGQSTPERLAADALDFGDVAGDEGASYLALQQFRERCLKVAAVCVAAVGSIDRANAN